MRALVLFAALFALPVHGDSEEEWTARWCGLNGLAHEGPALRLETATGQRVFADCISDDVVVEVDRAYKYKEGIGQALTYGVLSQRRHAVLLLIIERRRDCDYYADAEHILAKSFLRIRLTQTGNIRCPEAP